MKNKNIILYIVICLVVIAGLAVWEAKGFRSQMQYAPRKQIQLLNKGGIDISEVEQMASEVLGNTDHFVQDVENFHNAASIVSREITEEQKNSLVEKFNEKYKTELKAEEIEIESIPFTRIKDIVRPFILPGIITLAAVIVYFAIRFRKIGWKQVIAKTILAPLVAELLVFSIMAIIRVPMGRLAVALGVGIYGTMIIALTCMFENQKNAYVEKAENNNQ